MACSIVTTMLGRGRGIQRDNAHIIGAYQPCGLDSSATILYGMIYRLLASTPMISEATYAAVAWLGLEGLRQFGLARYLSIQHAMVNLRVGIQAVTYH
jgi:hypothetical protein